jgi:hypothetical protein
MCGYQTVDRRQVCLFAFIGTGTYPEAGIITSAGGTVCLIIIDQLRAALPAKSSGKALHHHQPH